MDGRQHTLFLTAGVIVLCLTIILVLLFVALWPQRAIVAWSVLAVSGLTALVLLAGKVNEIRLRSMRFHHHTETPLDKDGYPTHLPAGAQPFYPQPMQPQEGYPHD